MTKITYPHYGGVTPDTAALRNVLLAHGRDHSEALIFGVGGGLGAGYILWEFNEHKFRVLVLGWRHKWNYTVEWSQKLCERLNVRATYHEGVGKKGARQLDEALEAGNPPIAWVDDALLPYHHLPPEFEAHFGTLIAVTGKTGDQYTVDDLAPQPFTISAEALGRARDRISSYKARLLIAVPDGSPNLESAVRAGIDDCVDTLLGKSESFALPAFEKWGKLMTHPKDKKSWLNVFADPGGLFAALVSIYEGIELKGTGGGGMRGLYADFLNEAADILNKPALREVAAQYRAVSQRWSALADSALSNSIQPFSEAREHLKAKYAALNRGDAGQDATREASAKFYALYRQLNRAFPLSEAETRRLFESLGEQINALYQAEVAAATALKETMP